MNILRENRHYTLVPASLNGICPEKPYTTTWRFSEKDNIHNLKKGYLYLLERVNSYGVDSLIYIIDEYHYIYTSYIDRYSIYMIDFKNSLMTTIYYSISMYNDNHEDYGRIKEVFPARIIKFYMSLSKNATY